MRTPGTTRPAVVLVVDDEPAIREVVHLLLGDRYDVLEAASGPEAVDVVRATQVDLVILDVKLPGLDGISVLERMRATAPAIKVIMLTAIDAARTAVAAIKRGAVDYLTKPIPEDDLCEAVERALGVPERRDAANGVVIASDDPGWRASLAALAAGHGGADVLGLSLDRASLIPDWPVVIVDLIGARQSGTTLVNRLAASRRGMDLIVWTDDDAKASSGLPGDTIVIESRRRIAEVLRYICRRVRPGASLPPDVTQATWKALHVVANGYTKVTVEDVAAVVAISTRHLARIFRDDMGFTLKTHLLRVRIEAAKTLLRESNDNLETIAETVGLCDASHMGRLFRQFEATSPGEYRTSRSAMSEMS